MKIPKIYVKYPGFWTWPTEISYLNHYVTVSLDNHPHVSCVGNTGTFEFSQVRFEWPEDPEVTAIKEQNERLKSRVIEDMQFEIDTLREALEKITNLKMSYLTLADIAAVIDEAMEKLK